MHKMGAIYEQTVAQKSRAVHIFFSEGRLCAILSDGRLIGTPISWYKRLANATEAQRNNWIFIGNGEGMHWQDIDEDISVEGMLLYSPEND
jgi:hypothetical protein